MKDNIIVQFPLLEKKNPELSATRAGLSSEHDRTKLRHFPPKKERDCKRGRMKTYERITGERKTDFYDGISILFISVS